MICFWFLNGLFVVLNSVYLAFCGYIIWSGGRECKRNSDGAGEGSPVQREYGGRKVSDCVIKNI